jgi:hypothetical protein
MIDMDKGVNPRERIIEWFICNAVNGSRSTRRGCQLAGTKKLAEEIIAPLSMSTRLAFIAELPMSNPRRYPDMVFLPQRVIVVNNGK